jgi:hypothetical protein
VTTIGRHRSVQPDPAAEQPAPPRGASRPPSAPDATRPEVGIVLGSGLGGLADDLEDRVAIPFDELPGWPAATAPGHVGGCSSAARRTAVVMLQGRFHLYEGNDPGWSSSRSCCSAARRPRRRPDERGRRRRPALRPGTLMVIARPPQPDRPDAAARRERRRASAALPRT